METIKSDTEQLVELLNDSYDFFIQINGSASISDGWKLSIQGTSMDDVVYLFDNLKSLLHATRASYKFATKRLLNYGGEQSTKVLTIYIPNGVTPESYAELVRLNIRTYKGAKGIDVKNSYTKYSEGIFFRNDRNENGVYIPA